MYEYKIKLIYWIFVLIFISNSVVSNAQDLANLKNTESSVHGSFSATAVGYSVDGIAPRKDPFSYILSGNLTFDAKGIVLPVSFVYSNRNKEFSQPFNQFGLTPRYKWIKMYLGYNNVNFSKYVLGGHTVFGAGVELNPGILRVGVMYGRLQKVTNKAVKVNDPFGSNLGSFDRKMLSAKLGVGTKETFIDFIVMKAEDDSTSIEQTDKQDYNLPAANLVGGVNTRIKFSESVHFEGEGAYSVYTDNQRLEEVELTDIKITPPIAINASTDYFLAIRTSLIYRSPKGTKFGLNYRRIDPGYKSMGVYFINNDLENFTVSTAFKMLKQKMQIKGSIGLERNNLNTSRDVTTHKVIGSGNLTYNPNRFFGINMNYSNYSINQTPGRIQIADSIKIYQTNATLMIMPHAQFSSKNKKINHFITLPFTRVGLVDKNPYSNKLTDFTMTNLMFSYNLNFASTGLSFIASALYNQVDMATGTSYNKTGTIGIMKTMLDKKLNMALNLNITQSENTKETFDVITPVFTTRYRINKHHSFRFKMYAIFNKNQTDSLKSFNEQSEDFSYVYTF
jgi:hypothetical protein